ncbi:MAG: DUF4139 domain-containing protein [Phycisphaerae bacterium]
MLKDGKQHEGILCSHDSDIVLADKPASDSGEMRKTESISRDQIRAAQMPDVPKDLFVKPTLVWKIRTQHPGQHETTLMYACGHADCQADYVVAVTPGGRGEKDQLDLQGWMTIDNQTGSTYKDAGIKLIAGNVNRVPDPWAVQVERFSMVTELADLEIYPLRLAPAEMPEKAFVQKSFFEYHLYTLSAPSTVKDQQIKQLKLLKADGAKALRRYVFDSPPGTDESQRHVAVVLQFKNEKDNKLGMPLPKDPGFGREENKKVNVLIEIENRADRNLGIALPKGKCRVYKKDTDGTLEFIGEDQIDHTSRDERVMLYIGDAFDIVGERKQTDFRKVSNSVFEEAFEIKVRNHKKEAVKVKVLEKLYRWSEWEIIKKNSDFEQLNSRTLIFPVEIKPDGEAVITYRVRYRHP